MTTGYCQGDIMTGGFCRGDFFRGDFCGWIFSGGILSGGFYPGTQEDSPEEPLLDNPGGRGTDGVLRR